MTPGSPAPQAMNCDRCGQTVASATYSDMSNEQLKEFLDCSHYSTVCAQCRAHFVSLINKASEVPVDLPGTKLVEGAHYYLEKDLMVFTELYHVAKGYCCRSGCRHCPYGYKVEI